MKWDYVLNTTELLKQHPRQKLLKNVKIILEEDNMEVLFLKQLSIYINKKMQLDVGNEPYLSQQKSSAYVYAIICITSKWYDWQRITAMAKSDMLVIF